jgi:hypothetical protein
LAVPACSAAAFREGNKDPDKADIKGKLTHAGPAVVAELEVRAAGVDP